MVDRILSYEKSKRIEVQKFIANDNVLVLAHFNGMDNILPGVMLIEMVGQAGAIIALGQSEKRETIATRLPTPLLARCKARFISPARGGDLLFAKVELVATVGPTSVFNGKVYTTNTEVAEIEVMGTYR
jgi:3-hydroxymyristoyl/3-hydroxydecanoyl-(acyl carrier protein) dehydratase